MGMQPQEIHGIALIFFNVFCNLMQVLWYIIQCQNMVFMIAYMIRFVVIYAIYDCT